MQQFLVKLRKFLETRDRQEKTYLDDIDFEIASFCTNIFSNDEKIRLLQDKLHEMKEMRFAYSFYK